MYRLADFESVPPPLPSAVALTIDDGPNPKWTPAVLAVLARYQVKATFSVVGTQATRYPALVRQILAEGHGICNHTMTHPLPFLSRPAVEIDQEIVQGTAAIHQVTGCLPTVFRSPGGEWGHEVFQSCARMGQVPIDWNIDPRDWSRPGTSFITQRLLAAEAGDILLCHDGGGNRSETVSALQTVLPVLKARGLTFVTL